MMNAGMVVLYSILRGICGLFYVFLLWAVTNCDGKFVKLFVQCAMYCVLCNVMCKCNKQMF